VFDRKRKTREHSLENAFKRVSSSVKEISEKERRKEKRLSKRRRKKSISPCHSTYSTTIRMKIKREIE